MRNLLFLLLALLVLGSRLNAERAWIEVRSTHFRVLTDGSDKDGVQVARELERMRAVFAMQFPEFRLDTGSPFIVLVPRDDSSMRQLVPWLWKYAVKPAAYFYHGWDKQYAVVRADLMQSDIRNPDRYVFVYHEFIYWALRANFRWLPVWLEEGFAQVYGYTHFEQARMIIGSTPQDRSLLNLVTSKPLIPLDVFFSITHTSPYFRDRDKVYRFYAQSWVLTHFLIYGPGMDYGRKMRAFIDLLQHGNDQREAFEKIFGNYEQVTNALSLYLNKYAFPDLEGPSPQIDERSFQSRALSPAERDAEIGLFQLATGQVEHARALIQRSGQENPGLGLAHEATGLLDFTDGKDDDASREFSKAVELDPKLYLSSYWQTMLPAPISGTNTEQKSLSGLIQLLDVNKDFAPACIELAKFYLSKGDLLKAYSMARRAEQIEPSRPDYHLLTGEILLRMGQGQESARSAKYVADRWSGGHYDEAVDLWNRVPSDQRSAAALTAQARDVTMQIAQGTVKSITCGEKQEDDELVIGDPDREQAFHGGVLVLDSGGRTLTFTGKNWTADSSDLLWYGKDHVDFCHHLQGLPAVVDFKPGLGKDDGELIEVHIRASLAPAVATKKAELSPQ